MNARALAKRALPFLVAAAGGFLLAYVLVFLFAFPADVVPDEAKVPDVTGVQFEEAARRLSNAGFTAVRGDSRFHRVIAENTVLQQDPPAGSVQKRGAEITLALSAGNRAAVVPQVVGLNEQQARLAIENAGLQLGSVMRRSGEQARGAVIESTPEAGTRIDLPGVVNIAVSSGPPTVQVPDLFGRTLADARSTLEQLGLALGEVGSDTSSIYPENTVIGQLPAAGQTVSTGARVNLRLSRVPPVQPISPVPGDTFPSR